MKIFAISFLLSAAVLGQSYNPGGGSSGSTLPITCTGNNCTAPGTLSMPATVLGPNTIGAGASQLPAASSSTGQIRLVTDAASVSDCTTGGGTSTAVCQSNGTAWGTLVFAGRIGIGTGSPSAPLDVEGSGNLVNLGGQGNTSGSGFPSLLNLTVTTANNPIEAHMANALGIYLYTHSASEFRAPYINLFKSTGTQASPGALLYTGYELDSIGGINFGGYDSTGYFASAAIYSQTDQNWTSAAHGSHISIYGSSIGSTTVRQLVQFNGLDPSGLGNGGVSGANGTNILVYQTGIVWSGNSSSNPGLFGTSSPAKMAIRTADNLSDAALTASTGGFSGVVTAPSIGAGTLYSAAGTPLPSCAVGIKGERAVVSDATSPTYMAAYTNGGGITTEVICSYNGSTYSWLTH